MRICLLLVERVEGAHIRLGLELLHIKDLRAGDLTGVLDGALANLLIHNDLVHTLLDGGGLTGVLLVIISLVCVLVAHCTGG